VAKARILAVDDQRYFRELISGMLAEEGFEAQTASSGEEALHVLETADFDVVLTDLVMPGMDGAELVQRIKERHPDQDVVVVTGVVDVKTAVDAMKLGATDYLLKPFDRRTLAVTLDSILRSRRLATEHARLLAENIEYLGERSLYERALGLFSTLAVEPLAMRLADSLCLETRAQGAVVWLAAEGDGALELAAARGLVRLADEREMLPPAEIPAALRRDARFTLAPWGPGGQPALWASLRRDGRLAGLVRLTDKLEGGVFDAVDGAAVEKLLRFGDVAVANAFKLRSLERRGFKDAALNAYHFDYFRDVVRNEIEKAGRFGRSFAVLGLDLGAQPELAEALGSEEAVRDWLAGVSEHLRRLLRATDLLAVDDAHRFAVLLPEADGLGAAVLKRRALRALAESEPFTRLAPELRPVPAAGVAIYPGDGAQLEALLRTLDARVQESRGRRPAALGLPRLSLPAGLQSLARRGSPERPEVGEQIARFVLAEVARRPRERGLFYSAPGLTLRRAVREGLELLGEAPTRTELVVIGDGARGAAPGAPVSWVAPERLPGIPPFVLHFGDGPAYAMVAEESRDGRPARLFHTDDRSLVEHLAFQLLEELHLPASLGRETGP
jgi:DNA-binding response OmpR family regulator/GGDEF domain-containing protein